MGKAILGIIVEWFRDSQIAKGTATVAMGSSFGFITILGMMEKQIEKVNASVDVKIEQSEYRLTEKMILRTAYVDKQFGLVHEELKYQRGAIDATRDSVLDVLKEVKKR